MTLTVQIFQTLRRLFIILLGLTMTLFSDEMLISHRCIHGLMPNLIKKSWTVSTRDEATRNGDEMLSEVAFLFYSHLLLHGILLKFFFHIENSSLA